MAAAAQCAKPWEQWGRAWLHVKQILSGTGGWSMHESSVLGGKPSDGADCFCGTLNIYKSTTFLLSIP